MVNAKLYVICGNCGNNKFKHSISICTDEDAELHTSVLTCDDCATNHYIDEQDKDYK